MFLGFFFFFSTGHYVLSARNVITHEQRTYYNFIGGQVMRCIRVGIVFELKQLLPLQAADINVLQYYVVSSVYYYYYIDFY